MTVRKPQIPATRPVPGSHLPSGEFSIVPADFSETAKGLMPPKRTQSALAEANQAYRSGDSSDAMVGYIAALQQMPGLDQTLCANIARTCQQYHSGRATSAPLKVVVCGWELAHNAAGRAQTLAEIYREFAEVEIVGSIFPRWGTEVWEPMRNASNSVDTFIVEHDRFIQQAMRLVAAHPADTVHLSKPRGPNILFGVLYKLLWKARVVLDIDDEELAFVQAETPLALGNYLQQHPGIPSLNQLPDSDWTRLAVGLASEFDAITVSNIALQRRYGGEIICHARDLQSPSPSAELRQASRRARSIHPNQKVILFSCTPRPHKGLLEVARSIQSLHRSDILFVIAGSFGANYQFFKDQLQAFKGVNYLFLENQPLAALPSILALADCFVLMQNPGNSSALSQIPAELSEALAMRIPVIVTATPALADAIAAGAVIPATSDNLASQLAASLDRPNPRLADVGHHYFTEHLSLASSAARLQQLLDTIICNPLTPSLRQLFDAVAEHESSLRALCPLSELLYEAQSPWFNLMRPRHSDAVPATGKLAVSVHIYYPELWPEIGQRLKAIHYPFILDITTPPEQASQVESVVKQDFPAARIHVTPNRGRDILPFLSLVPRWQQEDILAVCKLHTKKGDGGKISTHWRKHLLETLVGNSNSLAQVAQAFATHSRLSLLGPAILYLSGQRQLCQNDPEQQEINRVLGQTSLPQTDWGFFAGTMFWARPAALATLAQLAASTASNIWADCAKDGQFEHALELAFGLIAHHQGGQIGLLYPSATKEATPAKAPPLLIAEAHASATLQLINPSHACQAVRQTFSLVDWSALRSQLRHANLVSIIVPIFNQVELTAACVASVYQHTATEQFELLLVDNGSDAPTQVLLQRLASQHSNLKLLRNAENLNFAHGCNVGFAASKGAIVIFLNNDTTVTEGWLPPLVKSLRRPDVAAVQPKLLYPDGTIQCIGVVFSAKSPLGYPIYAGMQPEHPWANHSRRYKAVTGACMGLRAHDFAELKGFDPIYINGQEDIDLCLRLNDHYKSATGWVATDSLVIHHESKTPNRFHHVAHNRRTYVHRWLNRVFADDQDYYAVDGFSVTGYRADSHDKLPAQLQVYRAKVVPAPSNSRIAMGSMQYSDLKSMDCN